MLKLTLRRFSVASLAATLGLSTAAVSGQLTELPANPRLNTPRSNDTQPEADSRAGGALSRDATPIEGAEIVDGADIRAAEDGAAPRADVDVEEGTVFAGVVTGVSDGRIAVQMSPPRVARATEQVFKISTRTPIMVNGQKAALGSIKKGNFVRIVTMPGDPEVASRIVVATSPAARDRAEASGAEGRRPPRSEPAVAVTPGVPDEDQDTNFDVFPERDSSRAKRGERGKQPGMAQMRGGEEAVLPLGIEVFGPGEGALVTEMLAEGPAAQAGILIGDYITQVNRNPIGDPELIEQMMLDNGGTGAVVLTVMRDGQPMDVTVEPARVLEGSLVDQRAIFSALAPYGFAGPAAIGGVGAVNAGGFAPGVGLPFGGTLADFNGGGVQLTGQGGQFLNGLQPNDVIVDFNGQPITNRAQLLQAYNGLPQNADSLGMTVLRNGERVTVDIPRSALNQSPGARGGVRPTAGNVRGQTGVRTQNGLGAAGTNQVPRNPAGANAARNAAAARAAANRNAATGGAAGAGGPVGASGALGAGVGSPTGASGAAGAGSGGPTGASGAVGATGGPVGASGALGGDGAAGTGGAAGGTATPQ
ncbi:MAG: PDZ domain-containing protein [Planctomycetota bacterium]|nr:PDZ domain-containing protein [Planctomycetota bacterium]